MSKHNNVTMHFMSSHPELSNFLRGKFEIPKKAGIMPLELQWSADNLQGFGHILAAVSRDRESNQVNVSVAKALLRRSDEKIMEEGGVIRVTIDVTPDGISARQVEDHKIIVRGLSKEAVEIVKKPLLIFITNHSGRIQIMAHAPVGDPSPDKRRYFVEKPDPLGYPIYEELPSLEGALTSEYWKLKEKAIESAKTRKALKLEDQVRGFG